MRTLAAVLAGITHRSKIGPEAVASGPFHKLAKGA